MKRDEVHVGRYYVAKISNKLTVVRIDEDRGIGQGGFSRRETHQGWYATNVETGRRVTIRTGAKLRREVLKKPPLCA